MNAQQLQEIIRLGHEITEVHDLDLLLDRILTKARQFVNADAGSIYIREGHDLRLSHSQNQTLSSKLPAGRVYLHHLLTTDQQQFHCRLRGQYGRKTPTSPDVYEISDRVPNTGSAKISMNYPSIVPNPCLRVLA